MFTRLRYWFIVRFRNRPDDLARRVRVENALMKHFLKHTQPSSEECGALAIELGVPIWARR